MVFGQALDTILGPVLALPPLWAVLVLGFLVSFLSVIITKYTTDQHLMKDLKDQLKAHQDEIKTLKNNPDKAMEVQKQAMDVNIKYMMHNMRATLFTFLPIILIFGWMSSHLSYTPFAPGQEFTTTLLVEKTGLNMTLQPPEGITLTTDATKTADNNIIKYTMKAEHDGEYLLVYSIDKQQVSHTVHVGKTRQALTQETKTNKAGVQKIITDYQPLKIINWNTEIPLLGSYLGWLGTYLISAIAFSMMLRKWLKVH